MLQLMCQKEHITKKGGKMTLDKISEISIGVVLARKKAKYKTKKTLVKV